MLLRSSTKLRDKGEIKINQMLRAYKLNDSDTIVTQKIFNCWCEDTDFSVVSLIVSIKEWAEEIELLSLDDEEDC